MKQVGLRIDAASDKKLGDNFNLLGVNGDNDGKKSREPFIELNKKLILDENSQPHQLLSGEKFVSLEELRRVTRIFYHKD